MILEELAEYARIRTAKAKEKLAQEVIREQALYMADKEATASFRFEKALRGQGLSFICEVKKASPSKGVISETFPCQEIARDYEEAGADAVSCLTEPKWFLGSDRIFCDIRETILLPMLRKDFTVDEYQLYEARTMGADAVLLLCALLDQETIRRYLAVCDRLGMSALVEAHDEAQIRCAWAAGARLIGVNNRNLKNFKVDFENAVRLRKLVPEEVIFVAESGVRDAQDIERLAGLGADAVLIGESLMRAQDIKTTLARYRKAAERGKQGNM